MNWNRLLWGVKFTGADGRTMLLGSLWHAQERTCTFYPGEPTRALLFQTRAKAREWCREKNAQNAGRTDFLSKWKFQPVRIREIVRQAKGGR